MLKPIEWIQFIGRGWPEKRKRERKGLGGREGDRERGKATDTELESETV